MGEFGAPSSHVFRHYFNDADHQPTIVSCSLNKILLLKTLYHPTPLLSFLLSLTVVDDHHFKDEMLFYRFRRDDNTVVKNSDLDVIYKGCDIYYR